MKTAVVGLGIVGGSIALGLKENPDYTVFGLTRSESTAEYALSAGMISKGSTRPEEILPEAELVIICLYPDAMESFVRENAAFFRPGAVLMDVTGIKRGIVPQILAAKPPQCDFVFTHPMAGRESRGIKFASADVLKGANFLIVPAEGNRPESLALVEKLAKDCGFGKITRLSPEEHDRGIAFTSQLSHVIAVALVNASRNEAKVEALSGDSYRGITRIASINEDLWAELFMGNREYLLEMIALFEAEVDKIKLRLEESDPEGLKELFRSSARIKNTL
ncbi:MAG: prephenate dehydrogenase [Oscillospiraceae bacterium]|jgi:prephenate dehydrogenase|nr:prephenate dehydrogenase [Oscillospiraceae bacterium]